MSPIENWVSWSQLRQLISAARSRGHGQDLELLYTTSCHCWGWGKGVSSREKGSFLVKKAWQREQWRGGGGKMEGGAQVKLGSEHFCMWITLSFLSIVTLTVCFLISLLFSVHCSYLNSRSSLFKPAKPIQPTCWMGQGTWWIMTDDTELLTTFFISVFISEIGL